MTRILFVNDTSGSTNPGCKAATSAVRDFYAAAYPGAAFRSLAVGYQAEAFAALVPATRNAVVAPPGEFRRGAELGLPVDHDAWEAARCRHVQADPVLNELASWAELVVVNGEGSMHHNFPRGLALLAQMLTLLELGKPVHLVNATLQAMDETLLRRVLPWLGFVHVRERRSAEAVQRMLGRSPCLTPDLAVAAHFQEGGEPAPFGMRPAQGQCLLTSGVLVQRTTIVEQASVIRRHGWEPVYFAVGDGGESATAAQACAEANVPLVAASQVPWQQIVSFLGRFTAAVSGRHHMNLFLALAGVPFVPLPSNSWKIEATLEELEYPFGPCRDSAELGAGLSRLRRDYTELQNRVRRSAQLAQAKVRGFPCALQKVATDGAHNPVHVCGNVPGGQDAGHHRQCA